jgi:hypothetical protein
MHVHHHHRHKHVCKDAESGHTRQQAHGQAEGARELRGAVFSYGAGG